MHQRLRETRKKLKIRQSDMAKILKISTATYNRYERGFLKPDVHKLCTIADKYNVSTDYLLKRTDIPYLIDTWLMSNTTIDHSLFLDFIVKYSVLGASSKKIINALLEHEYSAFMAAQERVNSE